MGNNEAYNTNIERWADYTEGEQDLHGYGKRIPYIGWFWRQVDFDQKQCWIGDSDEFIGVIQNNKWDYPDRMMSEEEITMFMGYLEHAWSQSSKEQAEVVFDALWDWFQTLRI